MLRLLIVAAVLAASTPAHAEFWVSSMGELLKTANRIEVIDVTAVKDQTIEGTLVTAVRSAAKPGAKITHRIGYLPAPKPGDRLVVICDFECPRAIGVEHGGLFSLVAQQPMDGALVTPNVVEASSLSLLAAGQPAPDLCVRGIIELLDDVARPGFEVKVRPADGSGRGSISGHKVNASLSGVWFASESNNVAVKLSGKGSVELVADHVAKDKDGCYSSAFAPSTPLARTAKSLDRGLDKQSEPMVVARGTLVVAKGAPVPAGAHKITFSVTPDGYLELTSDLAEGRVSHVQHDDGHYGLGFGTRTGSPNDPELFFDFPVPMLAGFEHGSALAKVVRAGTTAQLVWIRGAKRTSIGALKLEYVREPADVKP
ncbi:MAG: hypothetical protein ABI175_26175, partial [Polyangiales bacterium]